MTREVHSSRRLPRVSIAMCTFNGAAFVAGQLKSIAAQSMLPDELLICDDGSSDETIDIVNAFAENAPFTVGITVNPRNLGISRNFEQALLQCAGDIIFFADQDDIWHETKIERMVRELEAHPECGFAFSDARLVNREGNSLGCSLWDYIGFDARRQTLFKTEPIIQLLRHVMYGNTLALRREWVAAVVPIKTNPTVVSHDTWIGLILSSLGARGLIVADRLIDYRQHAEQASGGMAKSEAHRGWMRLTHETTKFADMTEALDQILAQLLSRSDWAASSAVSQKTLMEARTHMWARSTMSSLSLSGRVLLSLKEILAGRYARFKSSNRPIVFAVAKSMICDVLFSSSDGAGF